MNAEQILVASKAMGRFSVSGDLRSIEPYRRGHIHDTFVATFANGAGTDRFLLQRLNQAVFEDIPALMHNVELVTRHLANRPTRDEGDLEALRLVPTRDGTSYHRDGSGCWRAYEYIENTETFDRCSDPDVAYEAARAFGAFQAELEGLDAGELRETIPDFFSSPARLRQFEQALHRDALGRARACRKEIEFALSRSAMAPAFEDLLRDGRIPRRIVHGDTKLNNILFDRDTGRARSVVDLDTCMAGYTLYDFGDLVRFTAATSDEDETDVERAGVDLELYRAIASGYLDSAGRFLLEEERLRMPLAARLVTYTIGLRFLADHLNGDVYFKIDRPGHNLDRARVQFRMVAEMERLEDAMRAV